MKNKLAVLAVIVISFLFFQCQQGWIETPKTEIIEPNFPIEIKQWGESFASNLNCATVEAKQKNILKRATISSLENANCGKFDEFNASLSQFSKKQLRILESIAVARIESDSYITFSNILADINDEIYKTIPKTEQEKLLYITSALYYGLKEINNLVSDGVLLKNHESVNDSELTRLKSINTSTLGPPGLEFNYCTELYDYPERIPENCKNGPWWKNPDLLAAIWTIAIAEPTPAGETIALIVTGVYGSYLILTRAECIQEYYNCRKYTNKSNCDDCLHYCVVQGYWNCN